MFDLVAPGRRCTANEIPERSPNSFSFSRRGTSWERAAGGRVRVPRTLIKLSKPFAHRIPVPVIRVSPGLIRACRSRAIYQIGNWLSSMVHQPRSRSRRIASRFSLTLHRVPGGLLRFNLSLQIGSPTGLCHLMPTQILCAPIRHLIHVSHDAAAANPVGSVLP